MKYSLNSKKYTVQKVLKQVNEEDRNGDDYLAKSIGAFGRWQLLYVSIISLTRIVASWNTISVVFLAPETEFVCKKRINDSTTIEVVNNTCYDDCLHYEYKSVIFEDTLVSDFGLVCENAWLRTVAQSAMMFGFLCGVFLFGWLSDRFGRSKAMILSGVTGAIFMFITPFCPYYGAIVAARFLVGLGSGGYLSLTPVYTSELVGTRLIDIVVSACLLPCDGTSLPILAWFAYMTTSWQTFMIICSSVTVFIVSATFLLPETPRWLIAKGKKLEAVHLLTSAAKFNKLDSSNINENVEKITEALATKGKKDVNLTYLDLFRTRKLAKWTIASISMWFVTGFSYFGLLQHISQFGSNVYVVVSVLGLAQVIAAPLSVLVVKLWSRRASSLGIYTTIGVFSFALAFTPKGSIAAVVLGSFGVAAASVSFSVVYIIVIELYPTPMRNMGLSASSIGSKVAAIVAPFVVNMEDRRIASMIFAAAGFIAIAFCFLVPETKGQKLKDSIDDVV